MSLITADIRDDLYTRILVKQAASSFVFNNFSVVRTWLPFHRLEKFYQQHPNGVLFLVGATSGDMIANSRPSSPDGYVSVVRDYGVHLAFQKGMREDFTADYTIGDTLCTLVQQLEETCRQITPQLWAWHRIEPLKDENGVPFDYYGIQDNNVFGAYFTSYYRLALGSTTY